VQRPLSGSISRASIASSPDVRPADGRITMGLFKDMRAMRKQAESLQPPEYRGIGGGMRAMREGLARANEMLGAMGEDAARTAYLRANGRAGTATISAIRDTGTTINDNPVVDLDLHVTVGEDAPYAISHRQMISRLAIPSFQPGATLPVHVDPANPSSLTIG
jgi:hypothetical protein